jgi:hypothetical protein
MIAEPVGLFFFFLVETVTLRERVQATSVLTAAADALQNAEPPIRWLLKQREQRRPVVRRDFRGLHVPTPATAGVPARGSLSDYNPHARRVVNMRAELNAESEQRFITADLQLTEDTTDLSG